MSDMEHYHILAICHDHAGEDIKIFATRAEVNDYLDHAAEEARKVFETVVPGLRTANVVEFEATTKDGELHELFVTWGRHSDSPIEMCEMGLEARSMLAQLQRAMDEATAQVESEDSLAEFSFDDLGTDDTALFGRIDDFLKGGGLN